MCLEIKISSSVFSHVKELEISTIFCSRKTMAGREASDLLITTKVYILE